MAKTLEEDLADFLLGMQQRGSLNREYYKACFRLWEEVYGAKVVQKVRSLVKASWKD